MTPETLIDSTTVTVLSFRRNRYDAWRNTATGEILFSGKLSLDCGHAYTWHPHGATEMPARGDRLMCARCLESILKQNTPAS